MYPGFILVRLGEAAGLGTIAIKSETSCHRFKKQEASRTRGGLSRALDWVILTGTRAGRYSLGLNSSNDVRRPWAVRMTPSCPVPGPGPAKGTLT